MAGEMGLRQAYATIKNAYRKVGRNPVTTASDLKLVMPLSTTRTSYSFPILVGDDANNYGNGVAILLNRSDAFTATEMGLFIGKPSGAPTAANSSQFDWYSYSNDNLFATGKTALKTLFNNSYINVTINNVQYLQNFSTLRLRRAPVTQNSQGFGTFASAPTAGYPAIGSTTQDSFNGESDGYYSLVPTLQLSGTSKISIDLVLPESISALDSNSAVMIGFRGFLSLGASNLNK
jgi:hypothetical protein